MTLVSIIGTRMNTVTSEKDIKLSYAIRADEKAKVDDLSEAHHYATMMFRKYGSEITQKMQEDPRRHRIVCEDTF